MFHTLSSSPPHFASPFSLIPTLLPNYPLYFSLSRHLLWNDQFVAQFRLSSMGAVCCRPQVCPAILVLQPPIDPFVPRSSTSMLTLTSFTSFSSDASARVLLARYSYLPQFSDRLPIQPLSQVRVVQHKQTRDLYALKYINKAKCVRMKAVANIIQERRLLEEVCAILPLPQSIADFFIRSTIHLSSIYDTPFKMTRTVFLSWI